MLSLLLRQEIEHTFQTVKNRCTSEELVFLCPQPGCGDSSGNRSVNLKTGKTYCWRCNIGGNFLKWAAAIGFRFDHAQTSTVYSPAELMAIQKEHGQESHVPSMNDVKLPRDFTRILDEPESVYSRLITQMAVRKNLDYDALAGAGVGFTREDPYWEPFALFPVYEYDRLVYFQGRTYKDVPGQPTKQFPGRQQVKYGARYWIHNVDELWRSKAHTAILVESILNVLSLQRKIRELGIEGVVPLCVFKHAVSQYQLYKLLRYQHLSEVCLMFDHDATKSSWRDAERLTNHFTVSVAEMPEGEDNQKLDPNDDVDTAMRVFEERVPFNRASSVSYKLKAQSDVLGGRSVLDMQNLESFGETLRS